MFRLDTSDQGDRTKCKNYDHDDVTFGAQALIDAPLLQGVIYRVAGEWVLNQQSQFDTNYLILSDKPEYFLNCVL